MSEKRKLERLSPLVIKTNFPRGGEVRQGYLTNLSETGAFLATEEEITVGDVLELHFVLPWGLGEHDAEGSVVWQTDPQNAPVGKTPTGVGIHFTRLDEEVTEGIRCYMQKFYQLLEQIEERGLSETLANLAKEIGPRSETIH
jgi:Tfp pilus assembly protein PilZ